MLDPEKILSVKAQIIEVVKKNDCNLLESLIAIKFAELENMQFFIYTDLKDRFVLKEPKK